MRVMKRLSSLLAVGITLAVIAVAGAGAGSGVTRSTTGALTYLGGRAHYYALQTSQVCEVSQTGEVVGCEGRGALHNLWDGTNPYNPASAGIWLDLDISYVNVQSTDAWFAGIVTASNADYEGSWLVVKVHDGGEPGPGVDLAWASLVTDEAAARLAVAEQYNGFPYTDGPLPVYSGNLQVVR
jgi:hypothetical protein